MRSYLRLEAVAASTSNRESTHPFTSKFFFSTVDVDAVSSLVQLRSGASCWRVLLSLVVAQSKGKHRVRSNAHRTSGASICASLAMALCEGDR